MIPIAAGLGYSYDSYLWNTGSTPTGTYYIVVKATDNQQPSATGIGMSGAFGIGVSPAGDPTPQTPPPQQPEVPSIVESYPTITNVNPRDKIEIEDTQPIISSDLTASDSATIETRTVIMSLDDEDISAIAILRGGDENDGSILYTPGRPLSLGSHKVTVSFEDSSGETTAKTWTFTIADKQDNQPNDDDDDEDTISIFGIEIPRRIAFIVGIGLILLLIALIVPWLFYAAWRRSKDEDWEDPNLPESRDQGGQPHLSPAGPDDAISGISAQPGKNVKVEEMPEPQERKKKEDSPPASPPPTSPEPSSAQPPSEPTPTDQPPITPSESSTPTPLDTTSTGTSASGTVSTDTPVQQAPVTPLEPSPDEELTNAFKKIAEEEQGGLPPAEPGLAKEDESPPPETTLAAK